jgi:beta-fructofuranosidase
MRAAPLLPPLLLLLVLACARAQNDGDDDPLTRTEAYRRLHPAYHIAPTRNWLNDPNGLFQFRGVYHVFYQHNPRGAAWGAISWAHVASTDLAHWTRLPLALAPGPQSYDADGVFSGSVTVVDGVPRLLYTCVSLFAVRGYYFQQQCAAEPVNASDPWLREWRKRDDINPLAMAPPPGGVHSQWRDPSRAWRDAPGGPWRLLLGAQVACAGAAALYQSYDFVSWSYAGLFAAQPANATTAVCSQFGAAPGGGVAWETPSAFPLTRSGSWVLLYGDQVAGRTQWQRNSYVIGSYSANATTAAFLPHYPEQPALALDGGEVYAAQTLLEEGAAPEAHRRRLLLGWAQETPPGAARGWQGVLTLPRVLGLSRDGRALTQAPAAELARLRAPAAPVHAAAQPLNGSITQLALPPSASRGTQREVLLAFTCDAAADACAAGVLLTTSASGAAGARTNITVRVSRAAARGVLTVDRWHTGGEGDARPQHAEFALPPDASPLRLHIFVDHSIVEAFAEGAAVASRVYPAADASAADWGVALFGDAASAHARVWELGSAWV